MQVKRLVIERREIDLEVAGMNHNADRGFNGERDALHEGVGDVDRLDGEGAYGELFSGRDLDESDFIEQLVLFELAFDVGQGELGCIDGNLDLAQNPRQAADVVLVTVGENDGPDMSLVFNQVGDVGDHDIDAEELRLGEHQAGVDHDNVVFPAQVPGSSCQIRRGRRGE